MAPEHTWLGLDLPNTVCPHITPLCISGVCVCVRVRACVCDIAGDVLEYVYEICPLNKKKYLFSYNFKRIVGSLR